MFVSISVCGALSELHQLLNALNSISEDHISLRVHHLHFLPKTSQRLISFSPVLSFVMIHEFMMPHIVKPEIQESIYLAFFVKIVLQDLI